MDDFDGNLWDFGVVPYNCGINSLEIYIYIDSFKLYTPLYTSRSLHGGFVFIPDHLLLTMGTYYNHGC